MAMAASVKSSYGAGGFKPGSADWNDPKQLGKCAQWLYAQRQLKDTMEQRTARNIAYYEGRQHYEWSRKYGTMRLPETKRDQLLLVFNVIKPLIQQKLAKMVRLEPVWTVPAYTSDEYDQVVARFSNDILNWYWNDGLRMSERIRRLFEWMFVSPICFIHPHWNPTSGDPVEVKFEDWARPIPEGTPPDLAAAQQAEDMESYKRLRGYSSSTQTVVQYTGDIDFEVVDIFKAMWYPFYADKWDNVHIFLKTDILAPEDVAKRYGLTIDEVMKYGKATAEMDSYRMKLQGWSSPFMGRISVADADFDNGILVHQLYIDSVLAPPYGRTAVVLGHGEEAIKWGILGNKYHQMPFRPMVEHQTPGVIWGTCTVDDMLPAQVELNKARNQQAEWRDLLNRPKVIRYLNDGADDESFKASNQDAIITVQSKDVKPDVLYSPQSGVEHEAAVAWDLRFMHDAAAVPDVSLGNTSETNAKSGIAVRSLQEEANERLKVQGEGINDAMSWTGSFLLAELQEKAVSKRLIPLVGENNSIEYIAWSRAMLRPSIYENLTGSSAIVRVTAFSNIPMTPTEMRRTVLELTNAQYLRPGEHDNIIAKVYGFNDLKTTLDKGRADRDKQEREISMWRMGQQTAPPAFTDDHAAHEEVLALWVKSDEYRQTIKQFPYLEPEITEHYELHSQGKYNEKTRASFRMDYAQMQVGAEFMLRALNMGRPDWASIFAQKAGLQMAGSLAMSGATPESALGTSGQSGPPGGDSGSPQKNTGNPNSLQQANQPGGAGGTPPGGPTAAPMGLPPIQDNGLSGRPGERMDMSASDPRAASYGAQGDAADFRRRQSQGKDRDGTPASITG